MQVFFMRSLDLLSLHAAGRPEDATWETLPAGEEGLQELFNNIGYLL